MNKLTFDQFEEIMKKANTDGKDISGVIVFKPESFEKEFTEEERSYKVKSNSKYFNSGAISKSLFGNSLDGSDTNVRLDWYMHALPEDKLGNRWVVDYCYLEDTNNNELDESMAKDAADTINNNDWYNSDKRKQTFEGMLADKIAEKAEELGDDYSEWLDQPTIEKMIEDLKNCEEVKAFYNTLDRLIEMYIEERVDWIRRDEPASRYYGREDLDESKKKNSTMDIDEEFIAISDTDPQNENEYFETAEDAIEYCKENDLDRVIKVNYIDDTEEEIWSKENLDESKKEEDYHGMYNNTYRGEDFQELAEMYGYGEISEEDLAEELLRLYTTIEGAKAAYNEITGKDMKEYSYKELIQINNKHEEDLDNTEDLLDNTEDLLEESNEHKNEDYTQASNAGAIKVDIIGQPKKKSKKDKEDPALKSLPVQQVLIEGKEYNSEDEIYNDLNNLNDE